MKCVHRLLGINRHAMGSSGGITRLYKIAEEGWGDTAWSESINKDTGTGMHLLVMLNHPFYFLMFFEVKQHTNHVISTFLNFISCLGNNCAKHVYDQGCLGKKYNQNALGKQVQLEYFRQTSTTRTTRTPAFWDTLWVPPWLPILVIDIRSQVKTRQSQSYKF